MKPSRVLLPLACCFVAFHAQAQSSVTLFGIIDEAIQYTSNQGGRHAYQMETGTLSASRWGLKGREDLGNGYAAIFQLENGFNSSNGSLGQNGRMFGRQAWVGIASPYGNLMLGRQYDLTDDFFCAFEAGCAWAGGPGTQSGDNNGFGGSYRLNNAAKFVSTPVQGLKVAAAYSFGGTPGSVSTNSAYSGGASYTVGGFAIAGSYSHIDRPNMSVYDGTATTVGVTVSSLSYSGFVSARTLQTVAAGVSYAIGKGTLGGTFSNVAFKGLGSGAGPNPEKYSGTAVLNTFEVSYLYHISPALQSGTAFLFTRANSVNGVPGAIYRQINLGGTYSLSARTNIYLWAYGQTASGTNSLGAPAVAQLAYTPASSTNKQFAIVSGIRHRF